MGEDAVVSPVKVGLCMCVVLVADESLTATMARKAREAKKRCMI